MALNVKIVGFCIGKYLFLNVIRARKTIKENCENIMERFSIVINIPQECEIFYWFLSRNLMVNIALGIEVLTMTAGNVENIINI